MTAMTLPVVLVGQDEIEGFGGDPWWLVLLKIVALFALLVVLTLFNIWFERRVVGRMQHRIGPNRTGPMGLLQSLADGVKLALKGDIVPKAADKIVHTLSPLIAVVPSFLIFAVIPIGPEVSIFGVTTRLQLTDMPVAVLYVLAVASVGVYGIVLAGWSSGSTYPLLGGMRSSAQVISYEIAMGLSFVGVFLYAGSMSTSEIVAAQQDLWFGLALIPSFAVYLVAMVGETNRAPFDLPEAEGELVGGFHTEYSSLKFALFFLAEYINMVNVSALATTLFLGGWRAPWPISAISVFGTDGYFNTGWWPVLWFFAKVLLLMFVFVWLRGTLPRLRYDQFMKLGWKVLIPLSLLWIVVVAAMRVITREGVDRQTLLLVGGGILLLLLVVSFIPVGKERAGEVAAEREPSAPFDPYAGGYPVPPLPGQQVRVEEPVTTSVSTGDESARTPADEESPGA